MVRVPLGTMVVSEDVPIYRASTFSKRTEKWYKAKVRIETPEKLEDIAKWMLDNIDGCRKHADWRMIEGGYLDARFRYERDCEWFILRWY